MENTDPRMREASVLTAGILQGILKVLIDINCKGMSEQERAEYSKSVSKVINSSTETIRQIQ
jgi:hypothetical protein